VEILIQKELFRESAAILKRCQARIRDSSSVFEWPRFWRLSALPAREKEFAAQARRYCRKGLREAEKQDNQVEALRFRQLTECL